MAMRKWDREVSIILETPFADDHDLLGDFANPFRRSS
jgi:hypothetical protein